MPTEILASAEKKLLNSKLHLSLIFLLAMAGCAQQPEKPAVAPAAPTADVAAKAAETKPAESQALPKIDLSSQTLYQFLLAEIAGQRGQSGLAVESMLDLAKSTRDYRLARRSTELALHSRQEARALDAARLWLILAPNEVRARQMVSALLVNSGRLDEAKIHLERLLADEDGHVGSSFLSLHQMLSRQSDKAGVLNLVQDLAAPYPQVPEAHFAVAQAAWAAEKDEIALREILEASRLRPGWEAAALFQGQILLRDSPSQALDFFKEYLDSAPKALEARLTYARLLVAEKHYAEARNQFEKLTVEFPQNAEVSVALGLLSMQLHDYDKAELHLKRALTEKYHDANSVKMYLGQLYEDRKQYSEALVWYGNVTPSEHALAAQLKYAAMLAKLNRTPEALQHLHQINVQNNQQRVQVAIAEAQLLRSAKSHQDAYELLGKMLEKLPNYPDLLYEHAMAAEKIGRSDVLEQDLRKLIQIKPDYAHAYNALGYTLAEHGERLEEAAQLIEKALKLSPGDPFIIDSMGWVQYRLGALDKALGYLKRAYAEQADPEIAAHLGEVLWAQGNREEASKIWQAAQKENPDNETLLDVIKKFKP